MIELKYQKVINDSLNSVIKLYDKEVDTYKIVVNNSNKVIEEQNKKITKLKNRNKVYKGIAGTSVVLMILSLIL